MGIGTSLGAYFETTLDHHAGNEYLTNPNSTPDNNELSTNEVMPKPDEGPKVIPIADFTPLTDKQHDLLSWDTPWVMSKDPALNSGTPKERRESMDFMMNQSDEDMKKQYDDAVKTFGKDHVVSDGPLPAGRIRGHSSIPAFKEYKDDLPDDVKIHQMEDGSWIFQKTPDTKSIPMS